MSDDKELIRELCEALEKARRELDVIYDSEMGMRYRDEQVENALKKARSAIK